MTAEKTVTTRPRRYTRSSWAAGLLVIAGLGWTIWTLLAVARPGNGTRAAVPDPGATEEPAATQDPIPQQSTESQRSVARHIEGVVYLPNRTPASGATVEVFRARTAAPELRRQSLLTAITGSDGTFVFDLPERHGLLIQFEMDGHARALVEVPALLDYLELELEEGHQLFGTVRDTFGAPVGGVRVAVESALDQRRRVVFDTTTTSGGFRFQNLRGGIVRLVARHERWQAVGKSILIGETRQAELRFTALAAAPLRGRVVTTGQVPIADALLELLPTNGRLGMVDPISARSGEDGTFVLPGLSRGPMSLLVRHQDFGTLRRTVSVGSSPAESVLELPPRSQVSGRIQSDEASALEVAGVTLQLTDTSGEIHYTATDGDGMFAFDLPLSPGRATLAALGGQHSFARSQSFELGVQIEEEARTIWDLDITTPTVVRGRCVDSGGAPLVGVSVYGSKQLTASRLIGSNLASFIGAVGQEVALTLGSDSDRLLAISRPDGTFEFTAQEPGSLLLRYELSDHARRSHRFVVPAADTPGQIEDVVMSRGCMITGVVRRARRPLAGATVTVVGAESQEIVITRGGGRFAVDDLMPGEYRVRARLPSMPTGHAEQTITVALDQASPALTLDLPPGRTVSGRVVSGIERQPVDNALVAVRGAGGQPTVTDASGQFSLELPARGIELEVSTADKSHTTTQRVGSSENDLMIQLDAPPTSTLVARVAGLPGRTRVPAVVLHVKRRAGATEGDDRARWVEVQNGDLLWPLCPIGRCRVEVRCEGFTPFVIDDFDFEANKEHDLGEILLERGARVRGFVVDSAGEPVQNARVFVGDETDLDLFEPQVISAADGSFEVGGVSSRSSALVAYAAGYAPTVRQLSLPGDVLGQARLELALEPGGVIMVEVENAPESGLVQLMRGSRLLATAVLDEAGNAEFVDRGPGRYSVRLYGSERASESVTIAQPGQLVRAKLE